MHVGYWKNITHFIQARFNKMMCVPVARCVRQFSIKLVNYEFQCKLINWLTVIIDGGEWTRRENVFNFEIKRWRFLLETD